MTDQARILLNILEELFNLPGYTRRRRETYKELRRFLTEKGYWRQKSHNNKKARAANWYKYKEIIEKKINKRIAQAIKEIEEKNYQST